MGVAGEGDDIYSSLAPFMSECECDAYAGDELTLVKIDNLSDSQSTVSIVDVETPRSASLDSTWMDELVAESASGTFDSIEMPRKVPFIKLPTLWEIALVRAQANAEVYCNRDSAVDAGAQEHDDRRS